MSNPKLAFQEEWAKAYIDLCLKSMAFSDEVYSYAQARTPTEADEALFAIRRLCIEFESRLKGGK